MTTTTEGGTSQGERAMAAEGEPGKSNSAQSMFVVVIVFVCCLEFYDAIKNVSTQKRREESG